jgi:hypothetical protein
MNTQPHQPMQQLSQSTIQHHKSERSANTSVNRSIVQTIQQRTSNNPSKISHTNTQ